MTLSRSCDSLIASNGVYTVCALFEVTLLDLTLFLCVCVCECVGGWVWVCDFNDY